MNEMTERPAYVEPLDDGGHYSDCTCPDCVDAIQPAAEPAPICFSNRIHPAHDNCAGLDADTLFERTMDAAS